MSRLQTLLPSRWKTPSRVHDHRVKKLLLPHQGILPQRKPPQNHCRFHELQRRHHLHGSQWLKRICMRCQARQERNGWVQTHDQTNALKSSTNCWFDQIGRSFCWFYSSSWRKGKGILWKICCQIYCPSRRSFKIVLFVWKSQSYWQ